MKKLILLLIILLTLTSCWTPKEDKKITTNFLQENYSKEFHELNLSNQKLTQVPNFEKYLTGSYIDNVWSINLMSNNIKEVNGEYFKYFPNLKEVNLSYNKIEKIKLEHNFIQDLKLHKNNLKKVDLKGLIKLNNLNLWYNELLSLNDVVLPKSIKVLELQHNKLTDLNWIWKLKKIEKLKVEFNELEDIDLQSITWLEKLKFISVGQNKLSKKAEEAFIKFNENNKEKN